MSEEDGEGGATTIQCGVLGDLEGEGGNDLRRRGANDDDARGCTERRAPWSMEIRGETITEGGGAETRVRS
ncbi:hypothetical protein ACSQ67_023656 [Phaseolus vulgaris]